ncbi:hypothetical protein GN958_ATG01933 [Phytophthora infestans]|uniref:Uncharacterized protein n=1 Tax=Phytophthora infestans TaxID=4787 RepID=A0A8S9UUF0_PHYIN|nr:hypothetical protein GN958_ATG06481 [Phytophthora infestans]KAF4148859.1 hypothetical protein GN958_ATG01933 [Phytophthora infestans]
MATEFRNLISDLQLGKSATTSKSIAREQQSEWRSWPWDDGKLDYAVPIGWEVSARANVKTMWNLWFFGDRGAKIRPYRQLSKQHDVSAAHRMRHSRVSIVMEYLEQLAKETTALPAEVTRISDLQIPTADKVFDAAFSTMMSNLYTTIPKRAEELSCGTLYNRL